MDCTTHRPRRHAAAATCIGFALLALPAHAQFTDLVDETDVRIDANGGLVDIVGDTEE